MSLTVVIPLAVAGLTVGGLAFCGGALAVWLSRRGARRVPPVPAPYFVLPHLGIGVMMFDADGIVTYANPAAERLLARPPGSLAGAAWDDLTNGAPPIPDVLRSGVPVEGALVALRGALHGPGAVTWIRVNASPLDPATLSPAHSADRVVCSLIDVTDLKAAEDALADGAEALRTVLDNAPVPIVVLRRRGGDVLLANRPAQEVFVAAPERPAAGAAHWLDAYVDGGTRRALLTSVLRHGPLHGQEVAVRPDGTTPQWMRVTAHPLSYFGIDAVMIAFADAREIRRLGRALAAAQDAHARVESDLGQVAGAVHTHLGDPIRAAEAAIEGIRQRLDHGAPPEITDLIGRAHDAVRAADTRMHDLVDYAHIGLGLLRPTMVDLAEVLQEVRRSLSMSIARHDAVLQAESHLPVLRADRAAIARVLEQLIDNALKFNHRDRRPVIRLSASQDSALGSVGTWHLRVSDNGQGIPQRHFERVFGLFQRLHPDGSHAGTGVGLAMCRRILAEHGGRIWIDSTEGEGTTVHVILPTSPADALPVPQGRLPSPGELVIPVQAYNTVRPMI